MSTLREILILPINSTIWRHNDLDYATASIKLCPEVGNDEYVIVILVVVGWANLKL